MIPKKNYQKAVSFLYSNARPLDIALFDYEFNNLSKEQVIKELLKFQNHDGGFGNGIEPDITLKQSSVIATTVALQYIDFAHIDPSHEIIERAINYLIDNFHPNGCYWSSTNLDVNDEPHAPWWSIKEINPPKPDEWANPNVEVIGYLNRYSHYVPNDMLKQCNSYLADYIANHPTITGFLYYNFLCWKRSLPHLPETILPSVFSMLDQTFSDESVIQENDFIENHIQWFVTEPSSYLNQKFPEYMKTALLKQISNQADDGGWYPTWKWGIYEEEWEIAKIEWAGKITIEFLSALKYHDLIEN